jgi:outer membrane protein TolC
MQSVNLLAQAALMRAARRVKLCGYRASYDWRALPRQGGAAAQADSDQTLLRYNGMLMSVFELLADAREQATVSGYIAALKDYWTAQANLEAALGGRLPTNKGVQP